MKGASKIISGRSRGCILLVQEDPGSIVRS